MFRCWLQCCSCPPGGDHRPGLVDDGFIARFPADVAAVVTTLMGLAFIGLAALAILTMSRTTGSDLAARTCCWNSGSASVIAAISGARAQG